ncbi:MAG: hypothetical protein ACTSVI_00025 [Promethearchaeota archaeon]
MELAVASIEGSISYDVSHLPSFRESELHATLKMENTGGADLNDVLLTERIQEGFKPPLPEQVVMTLNGKEINVPDDAIIVVPADQEPEQSYEVKVSLDNLREQDIGVYHPGEVIEVTYPIIAYKPSKDVIYKADARYEANTYPAGAPLVIDPVPGAEVEITVVHIRQRVMKGKEIIALDKKGEYEITLYVTNKGQFGLENYEIQDHVPPEFEFSNMSEEPELLKSKGRKILKWVIEKIAPGERH